jgi:hypothetical protein
MSNEEHRVGDVGTKLIIEFQEDGVVVDISAAVADGTKKIIVKRPDGTTFIGTGDTCLFLTDGTDGKAYYLTTIEDFTMEDTYYIQGFVDLPEWSGKTTIETFHVSPNL